MKRRMGASQRERILGGLLKKARELDGKCVCKLSGTYTGGGQGCCGLSQTGGAFPRPCGLRIDAGRADTRVRSDIRDARDGVARTSDSNPTRATVAAVCRA
jgi:hypothetical protein